MCRIAQSGGLGGRGGAGCVIQQVNNGQGKHRFQTTCAYTRGSGSGGGGGGVKRGVRGCYSLSTQLHSRAGQKELSPPSLREREASTRE